MPVFPKCLCGSRNYSCYFHSLWKSKSGVKLFKILECKKCSLLRTFPLPSKAINNAYMDERSNMTILWTMFAKRLIKMIKRFKDGKIKILDIGSSIGIFVKLAQEEGWEAIGIDIDEKAVKFGRKKFNIDLRCTELEKARFNSNQFDVVVLSHTLEHIFEPENLLKGIKRILKREGILIVQVPNIDGFLVGVQKIRGKCWYGYDPFHHFWHFTPKTICSLIEGQGYKILSLDTRTSLHYEKTGTLLDIPREVILKLSGLLGKADQITLVATPEK